MLFRLKLYVTCNDTYTQKKKEWKKTKEKRRHRKSVVKKTNDNEERVEYERNNYNAFPFDTLNQTVRCSQTAHNYMLVARLPMLQSPLLLLQCTEARNLTVADGKRCNACMLIVFVGIINEPRSYVCVLRCYVIVTWKFQHEFEMCTFYHTICRRKSI